MESGGGEGLAIKNLCQNTCFLIEPGWLVCFEVSVKELQQPSQTSLMTRVLNLSELMSTSDASYESEDSFVVVESSDFNDELNTPVNIATSSAPPASLPNALGLRTKSWSDIVALNTPTVVSDPPSRSTSPTADSVAATEWKSPQIKVSVDSKW